MDAQDRKTRAQLAAHTSWANTLDRTSRTANARAAAASRFEKQAREMHPDATEQQIALVAESLRKAYYARLGYESGRKRRAKAKAAEPAA